MNNATPENGFNRPRHTDDPYMLHLREEVGLGADASLEDIQPHAIELMCSNKVREAMELALNRPVSPEEKQNNQILMGIGLLAVDTPKRAFGLLSMLATFEEQ